MLLYVCHSLSSMCAGSPPPRYLFSLLPPPPRSTLFPLHDALPIFFVGRGQPAGGELAGLHVGLVEGVDAEDRSRHGGDRKSTRLNSSHANISYAVFCLKKKPIRP